jgi:hypothetical protein
MAVRRRIGNLAEMLLKARQQMQLQDRQGEMVRQRQIELAELNDQNQLFQRVLQDPELARRLARSGQEKFKALAPTAEEDTAAIGEPIQKAKSLEELPTGEDLFAGTRAKSSGDISSQLMGLIAQRNAKEASITSVMRDKATPTKVDSMGSGGVAQTQYVNPYDLEKLGPLATERTGEQEGQRAGATELAKVTTPGLTAAKVGEANKLEAGTRGEKVKTSAAVAGASEAARLREELRPDVLAKKLEFEKQKRIAELAHVGDKAQAEAVAQKSAAVKGLMPVYQEYRQLAVKVMNRSGGLGGPAASESTASALNALSKLPAVGEFVAAGAEAAHAALVDRIPIGNNAENAKDIALLNRLTDTLAQGMANAVLGNKGQTTENDRRTAKNILVNSFTSVKSGTELLAITDTMFGLLPTVAAANPNATPAEILTKAAEAAKQPQALPQVQQQQPAGPSPALEKLRKLRGGG